MANSDGSIIIDTELDNSGFDKGSKELLDNVKALVSSVRSIGTSIEKAVQTSLPLLQRMTDMLSEAYGSVESSGEKVAASNERMATSEQRAAQSVSQVSDALQDQAHSLSSVSIKAKTLDTGVSDLGKGVSSLSSDLSKMDTAMQNGFSTGNAVLRFKKQIDDAEDKFGELERQMKSFATQQIPTDEFQALTAESQKLNAEMSRLLARQDRLEGLGISHTAQQWQNLSKDIARVNTLMDENQKARFRMEREGSAYVSGADTAEYQQMNAQLDQIRAKLAQNKSLIDAEAISQAQLNLQVAQEAAAHAKNEQVKTQAQAKVRAAQAELNALAAKSSAKVKAPDAAAVSGWQKFKNIMASVAKTSLKAAAAVAKVHLKALSVAAKAGYTAFKGLGKAILGAGSAIKGIISRMKSFNKHSRGMYRNGMGLSSMFSNFGMMFGFSLISRAISAITKEVSESIGMLARFSDEFDSALSNVMNSVKALGGNITVTLSNALIAIEPILTQIIDTVSQAFTYLNALFAQLQGKSTVTVAKKQTDSYAESLEDAAESAEELKNQVYGFDELNKRSGQDKSSTDETEKQPEDLFEEVPIDGLIPEGLLDVFNKIKDAIENGDWYGLGQMAAEGLNNLLKTIDDWINNVFRPKGVEWAQNIAELLNGFVDAFDWTLLGKTVADGLNAVADIINTFLTTFNFENLGNGFGEAINGFFGNVEWDLIGQTFANGLNALIDFIFGLVNTIDWSLIGDSFAEFFNEFFFNVDWDKGTQAITTGLNGIIEAFQHFLDGVDWNAVGEVAGNAANSLLTGADWNAVGEAISTALNDIAYLINSFAETVDWAGISATLTNGINTMFDGVDWTALADVVNNCFVAFFDTLNTFLYQMDWESLGSHLGRFLDGLDVEDWLTKFGAFLDSFDKGVYDLFIGFFEGIDWGGLTDALWNGLFGMVENVDYSSLAARQWELFGAAIGAVSSIVATLAVNIWEVMKQAWDGFIGYWSQYVTEEGGLDFIQGLKDGIINALKGIGQWFMDNVANPIIEGFKSAFGIHSPSTVMAEMGGYIIEGLLQGITETWKTITGFFDENISALKEALTQKWNEIKESVSDTFEKLNASLSETAENISSDLSEAWDNIKSTAEEKWDKLKTDVPKKFHEMRTSLERTSREIQKNVETTWQNVQTSASKKWEDIKTTVTQLWNGLKTTLSQTDWSSIGGNLVSGLQRGIKNAWNTLTSTVSSLARSVTSTLSGIFGINSPSKVWKEIGEYLDAGLVEGIKGGAKSILTTTSNLAKSVNSSMALEAPEAVATQATMSGIDVLTDRFGAFIGPLRTIADMLSSVGTLYVPPVAAGAVAPHKIRAKLNKIDAGSGASVELSEGLRMGMNDQNDIMMEISYKLDRLIELAKGNKTITLNINELTGAITYAQRNRERNSGL